MAIYYSDGSNSADGRCIQVVENTSATQSNHSSTSYTDTNLSVNITPKASDSNILVMAFWTGGIYQNGYNSRGACALFRDSTQISERQWFADNGAGGSVNVNITTNESICVLDESHGTTSQITYKMKAKQFSTSYSPLYKFGHYLDSTGNALQTIIAMEIAD